MTTRVRAVDAQKAEQLSVDIEEIRQSILTVMSRHHGWFQEEWLGGSIEDDHKVVASKDISEVKSLLQSASESLERASFMALVRGWTK